MHFVWIVWHLYFTFQVFKIFNFWDVASALRWNSSPAPAKLVSPCQREQLTSAFSFFFTCIFVNCLIYTLQNKKMMIKHTRVGEFLNFDLTLITCENLRSNKKQYCTFDFRQCLVKRSFNISWKVLVINLKRKPWVTKKTYIPTRSII